MTDDTNGHERSTKSYDSTGERREGPAKVGGLSIRLQTLGTMTQIGEMGVDGVTDRLRGLDGGAAVTAERATAGYVPGDGIAAVFDDDDQRVGVRVSLSEVPGGYVLVVFGIASANRAATMMLSNAVDDLDDVPNDLAYSAVKELGGMIAYGFVDEFADAVDRDIDVRQPLLFTATENTLVRRTLNQVDRPGLYIASRLRLSEHDVTTDVYLFPDSETIIRELEDLEEGVSAP